jgi:hypothetical protein
VFGFRKQDKISENPARLKKNINIMGGGDTRGLMQSEFEGKQKKPIRSSKRKKITLDEAKRLITDHVHCTDQEAMELLEMMQERIRFLESDSQKSA